jgi:hypothetical protein
MKILPLGAELFHTDGQTDITKLTVTFAVLPTRQKIRQYIAIPCWQNARIYCGIENIQYEGQEGVVKTITQLVMTSHELSLKCRSNVMINFIYISSLHVNTS